MKNTAIAALFLAVFAMGAFAASPQYKKDGDCLQHRPWGDNGALVLECVRGKGGLESRAIRVIDPLGNVIEEDGFFLDKPAADRVIAAQPGMTPQNRVAMMPIANALQVFYRAPDGRLLFTIIPLVHLREAKPNPAIWTSR